MTLTTPSADPFIDEMRAYLAEHGLAVVPVPELASLRAGQRKPRAASSASTGRADGCTPAKVSSSKHQRCAAHWRVPGMSKPVCIAPAVDPENGAPIAPEWSDTDTVLAFAYDCGARVGDGAAVLDRANRRLARHNAEHREQRAPDCADCDMVAWHERTDAERVLGRAEQAA